MIILVILACSFVLFGGIVIYLLLKRKNYSRERFAFFSSMLVFSFASLVLTHIISDNSLLITLIKIFNLVSPHAIIVPSTDWTGKILSVIVLGLLVIFVSFIFSEWSGGRSKEDIELEKKYEKFQFMDALIKGAQLKEIKLEVAEHRKKVQELEDVHYLDENKDWHTEAKELLRLISKQYIINEDDWHSTESIYVSKYSTEDIIIYCCLDMPSDKDINEKINYVKTYCKNKNIIEVIVMSKNNVTLNKKSKVSDILITYMSQDTILESLVDFSEYFNFINEQFIKNEITKGDKLKLEDTYVIPKGKLINMNDEIIDNLEEYILNWTKDDKSSKHISLLGEYGQGKSVLSLKIAYEMIKNKDYRIPIIIELRGKSPKNDDTLNIIAGWASTFDISAKAVEKLLFAGKLLIILEGFDEMDLIGDSHTRHLHFKRLLEFMRFEKSKVIITGRPNLFLDTNEMNKFLQFNSNSNKSFYSEPIHLLPLNTEQIEIALRKCNESTKKDILELLKGNKNQSFIDLISRPSTLYQTSIIWDNLDKKNINSASVINEFIKHSYRRQESKLASIGRTGVSPILTVNEREYFMMGIATGMIIYSKYSNQINKNDLESLIRKLYYGIPDEISIDDVKNQPLKERLKDNSHIIETVFNDVRTSGILVKDFSSNDSFKFAHKSFLEFLFSLFFVHKVLQKDEHYLIISNAINNSLSIKDIYDYNTPKCQDNFF